MISNLITCLLEYKVACEYKNIDFDADKPCQYNNMREEMAKIYQDDEELFGPYSLIVIPENSSKEEKKAYNDKKKLVTRGYQRVREKIKDLRQGFSKAILSGTRSGSGELVYDNYDRLKQLWGGCPNTQPLSSEIDSNDVNTVGQDAAVLHNSDQQYASIELEQSDQPDEEPDDIFGAEEVEDNVSQTSGGTETPESQQQGTKPKDHVAVLVDDKRKHLERRLSASQRDALLLKEAKEDREERKEFRDMLKNANDSFVHALNNMSQSMLSINNAIATSIETFSNTAHSRAMPLPYYGLEQQQVVQQQNGYIQLQPARSVFYEGNQ
jgi:hypothetical protein